MSRFAIKTPYLIVVCCLVVLILGVVCVAQMPVDLFPSMDIPVVAVATFYSGMPPEQIEGNITYHLERFFTLASGIDHMESRSLAGVSLIKVYFQPGTNPDSAVTDRKSTRLNSSHMSISYAVFCLKKKRNIILTEQPVSRV